MKNHWSKEAVFYHIYPLGLCGAPLQNDYTSPPTGRLKQLHSWADHISNLGCNALYLGPLFESGTHGYDTTDYYATDRRLGTNEDLKNLVKHFHEKGIKVILDGVFNHVSRDFWAFRDLLKNGQSSPYKDWFHGVDFNRKSPYGDPFNYEGWNGHHSLVKLNLHHPHVRAHIFDAVKMWIDEFNIDGLRLDAADVMDLNFLADLSHFCHRERADFWLLGEVIHGDYRHWTNEGQLDSVTNYECYKGLYSSHNDGNYFEIAHSLNRLFGDGGLYKDLQLYSFADNHDVNRIASTLKNVRHLYPLHALLYTMPGIPSIYYGSEWGLPGMKKPDTDTPLRPALALPVQEIPQPGLAAAIQKFAGIRKTQKALREGNYQQLFVSAMQFAFVRKYGNEEVIVAVNAAETPAVISIPIEGKNNQQLTDLLDSGYHATVQQNKLVITIPACWARILKVR